MVIVYDYFGIVYDYFDNATLEKGRGGYGTDI